MTALVAALAATVDDRDRRGRTPATVTPDG